MKYFFKTIILLILGVSLFFQACEDVDDKVSLPIQDFIWKGLNLYYYWQADVPNLSDDRFASQGELNSFLSQFNSPENLFESLLFQPDVSDKFSVIFSDYVALEQALSGTSKTNGLDFELRAKPGSATEVFGWVRYVLPNTDAAIKNIPRGAIFYAVNGTTLTRDNFRSLLAPTTYTLNFANFDGGVISPNGTSVSLTKAEYSENPVYNVSTFQLDDKKVGYVMYNGFFTNFESQLNQAFTQFSSEGVTHLIVDLRYNSGGSVATATRLASMITGGFNGQIFAKQQWNNKVQSFFNSSNPERLLNRFTNTLNNGSSISSLNLNKVYILTSKVSASASELLINGLKPYINVVQIGETTVGKNVGSVTLYDSPDFTKNNLNPNHRYAMQPIVLKILNKDDFGDYQNGLVPNVSFSEDLGNLGEIGTTTDPFLQFTLTFISNGGRLMQPSPVTSPIISDSKSLRRFGTEMYIN